ncbi:hypothetical protein FE772_12445 [Lysobacter enzymogenes]|nr:hypothetical protein [Lysobacter enzymogenes]QCW26350.1 hypothetical protein FE772_12445 [Lysobacter enzymogenes]
MSAQAMFERRIISSHAQPHRGFASAGSRRAGRTCQNCQEPPQPRRIGGHTELRLVRVASPGLSFEPAANRAVSLARRPHSRRPLAQAAGATQARADAPMPSRAASPLQASNSVRRHSFGFLRTPACVVASLPASALDPS